MRVDNKESITSRLLASLKYLTTPIAPNNPNLEHQAQLFWRSFDALPENHNDLKGKICAALSLGLHETLEKLSKIILQNQQPTTQFSP